jgi:hypothetical protein
LTAAIKAALAAGADVNEVEAAGNTPLHNAAYEGWAEGCEALLNLGAKVNASNNAGDTPWHWATNMGHEGVMALLEKVRDSRGESRAARHRRAPAAAAAHPPPPPRHLRPRPQAGASKQQGQVLVQDHVPKVKDFFSKECWAHHPKPHAEYMELRAKQDAALEAERAKLIPGM